MVDVGNGLAERMLQVGTDMYWLEDSELQVMYCEGDGLMTELKTAVVVVMLVVTLVATSAIAVSHNGIR